MGLYGAEAHPAEEAIQELLSSITAFEKHPDDYVDDLEDTFAGRASLPPPKSLHIVSRFTLSPAVHKVALH